MTIIGRTFPPRRRPNQVIVSGPENQVNVLSQEVAKLPGHVIHALAAYRSSAGAVKVILVVYQPGTTNGADHTEELNGRLL